jgi:hypothetical protein
MRVSGGLVWPYEALFCPWGEDIYLTDGAPLPTMVVAASLPGRRHYQVSTRGGEMSAQLRDTALKGRQTCRFLARFSADIAA